MMEQLQRKKWYNFKFECSIKNLRELLVISSFVMLFIFFLFYYPFTFNFEIDEYKYYFVSLTSSLTVILWITLSLIDNGGRICLIDALIIIPLMFNIFWIERGNELASNVVTIIIYTMLLKSVNFNKLHYVLYMVLGLYLIQLVYTGFYILFQNEHFNGTVFHNTGVFAIYSIVFAPLFKYLLFKGKSNWRKIIWFIYTALIISLIVMVKSRTAIVAIFLVYLFPPVFLLIQSRRFKIRLASYIIIFMIIVIFVYFLFSVKNGSSIGRVLMLKISFLHLQDYFWTGVGLGNFTWYYPNWQADYFKNFTSTNIEYILNAGDTYVIFNEFVQLLMTIGFPCFIIFIFFAIGFLRHNNHTAVKHELSTMIKNSFFTIIACSLTYYTLHINVILLVIVLYSILFYKISRPKIKQIKLNHFVSFLILIFSCFVFFICFKKYEAVRGWEKIKLDSYFGTLESRPDMAPIVAQLCDDGRFLVDYGVYIYENYSDFNKAAELIELSKEKKFISKVSIENLAYIYLDQKAYYKAIESFEWLVNFIPHKFGYRLELIKLYLITNQLEKASHLTDKTLSIPVKIKSEEALQIKREISYIKEKLNQKIIPE